MKRVVILELPGMLATSLSLTRDVLGTANRVALALKQPAPFEWENWLYRSDAAAKPDLLIVPGLGCTDASELAAALESPTVREAVRTIATLHAAGTVVASSCAGVALLAEAGVLDGRRAATSWFLRPAMVQRYPRVRFIEGAMLIDDGRCVTGGAALAQGEVMLTLVLRHAGAEVANLCARYLLLDNRRSQQPYVSISALALSDELLARADAWARINLARPFSMDELAEAAGTTQWTLARRFQRVCGLSPSRFVQQLRAEEASRRLAQGARFDETAYAVGFSDPSALRKMLKRLTAN